jgi:purine-binding chemotaxis protein CheW
MKLHEEEKMSENNVEKEEFIVFRVGQQEFCVEITMTREIRGWTQSTTLPHSPSFLMGVINLRGTILPIVNLAKRLGLPYEEPTERHVIIVVQVEDKTFGMLVDSVSDILDVGTENLRSVPELDTKIAEDFFNRVIVLDDRIICEIIPDKLMPDMESLAA